MSDSIEEPDHNDGAPAADERMADVLRDSSDNADLRRQLQGEQTAEASDLLSRLNALDFVEQVVGGDASMPERIGVYDIKGLLGRGGMGIVYLGWQEELEREVALKVLSQNYTADPTMRKRFRAEARATAALHHRHIVPIYDYGESHGMLFFAMERVNGLSLDKHISAARRSDKSPMMPLDAARRFAGVADALGLAHRRRLLHRDVKPGNILVAEDGTMALTDFGLAKALDHASMQLTSKGGGFLGTLHYASPEQALGRELTPASDLYSLGVTMFESLTGRLPLAGKTTEALLQSILHGTPARLREHVHKPPRDLEAVIDKLLSREPDDRYQDGEELSRDLLRIAEGDPVHIRRLPLHVRVYRRARKNPVLTGALIAVFVLVLSTTTLIGVLSREKGKGRLSSHQNTLVSITDDVGLERGPAWGPQPLFEVLTGVAVADAAPSAGIVARLKAAFEGVPDDPQPQEMLRAYTEDPLPQASAYLREGRGYEALQLCDIAILQARDTRTGGGLSDEIELYRLFLASAVANLTASVGQVSAARKDLALAAYLRPGAVFPGALTAVLDVVESTDVANSVASLRRNLAEAAPERVQAVAVMLWAAAAHRPHIKSNLMRFGLDYQHRRALHKLAHDLIEEDLTDCVTYGEPVGLAAQFAEAGREAMEMVADPMGLRKFVDQRGQEIRLAVHPNSELHGWRHLLQLLAQPRQRGPLLSEDQRALPPVMQLAAWRALVALNPTPNLTRLWMKRFEEFVTIYPGLPGVVAVAARMHLLAESSEAQQWAKRWVLEEAGDPSAQLCQMQLLLGQGRVAEATDAAMVAVQNSPDREIVLRQIVRAVGLVAKTADGSRAEALVRMAAGFQRLVGAQSVRDGGGR